MKNHEKATPPKFCRTCGNEQNDTATEKCDSTMHNTMMTWGNYEFCPHCGVKLHPEKEVIKVYGAKFCKTCGTDETPHKKAVTCISHHPAAETIPGIIFCIYCRKNLKSPEVPHGTSLSTL